MVPIDTVLVPQGVSAALVSQLGAAKAPVKAPAKAPAPAVKAPAPVAKAPAPSVAAASAPTTSG